MDTYRGLYGDRDDAASTPRPFEIGDDEVLAEPPPPPVGQDERRMQVRAYNHWASLLGDRSFPAIDDLKPNALPDFGPHSVLLDFSAGIDDPAIQFLGFRLAEECGAEGPIRRLGDVPSRSLLSRITDHYMQILANQAPIGFEAEFVNQRSRTVLYRGILLPFSSDDEKIDFIYGVINWKELADQHTTDELMLEIDQALDAAAPEPTPRRDDPLTVWADGPVASAGEASVLDLGAYVPSESEGGLDWPAPGFGNGEVAPVADETPPAPVARLAEPVDLADWLASARELARAARSSEDRTRAALYAAIGRAWDFALAAADEPEAFAALVAEAALTVQERAPMTPVVKLVFGADYDKTRLTEYASALAHAQRLGIGRGALAAWLAEAPGGLKGVVEAERRAKRDETGRAPTPREVSHDRLAGRLRNLTLRAFDELPPSGNEFPLLLCRRLPTGRVVLLGEVTDETLLERAAKQLLG